ncbi:hypothetical protein PACTADRAFT_33879 [Pachysolen tannophilus NRRL Y-2460]|uniref:Vacuolar ATPase assembly protein VMA22 n=1 Tax=Pachysolen tannophilus NRRL Y-2460 TaxID=669874 RepID=A0A1E4TU75_PACTA|nr:hypothetical protein PACTADRAFT_33879 [Pachysolen tannophilus NRRL Y-2460]
MSLVLNEVNGSASLSQDVENLSRNKVDDSLREESSTQSGTESGIESETDDLPEDLISKFSTSTMLHEDGDDQNNKNLQSYMDLKMIEYLNLLNKYELKCQEYRMNFVNGFINLSRANYANGNNHRRFNRDYYDLREVKAIKIVETDENNNLKLIDLLELQKKNLLETKEKEIAENEDNNNEKEFSTLRNRNQKNENFTLQKKSMTFEKKDLPYRDPINMFGILVPFQLKESKKFFEKGVYNCIEIINLKNKLSCIYKEIKELKKESKKKTT